MVHRLELTLSDETWTRLNEARGHEPRASFVKRALAGVLDVEPLTPEEAAAAAREAYESPLLEQQLYAEGDLTAVEKQRPRIELTGQPTQIVEHVPGCPECGGDMRARDALSRVCADCGFTERF